jgi:TM2 domain-containing membrane protein YozV
MNTTSTTGETYHIGGISRRSLIVALLLAWLLGAFGAHRFYTGKTGNAIAQICLSFTVAGLIITISWALVDLIMIADGSFRDKEGMLIRSWESRQ